MENMRENIYLDCLIGGKGERFWCDSIIQVFFSQTHQKKKKKINPSVDRYMERKLDWARIEEN